MLQVSLCMHATTVLARYKRFHCGPRHSLFGVLHLLLAVHGKFGEGHHIDKLQAGSLTCTVLPA